MFTSSVSSSSSSSTSKVLFHFFLFSLGVVRIRSTTPTTCFTILLVSIYLGTKSARTLYVDSQVVGCTSPVAIRSRSRHGYRKSQPTSSFFIFQFSFFLLFFSFLPQLPTCQPSLTVFFPSSALSHSYLLPSPAGPPSMCRFPVFRGCAPFI